MLDLLLCSGDQCISMSCLYFFIYIPHVNLLYFEIRLQMLGEAERSLHDSLCVLRSLVKQRYLIAGGGMTLLYLVLFECNAYILCGGVCILLLFYICF